MFDKFIEVFIKSFYSYKFFIFILSPTLIIFYNSIFPLFWQSLNFSLFLLILLLVSFFIWFRWCRKLPITKKNKVGIVVGIVAENDEQKKKLKTDFLANFKSDLKKANNYNLPFEVIELNEYRSEQIINSDDRKEYIKKINKSIKGHLFLYGDIKERMDGGKEKYYINFSYLMFHKKVDESVKVRLQQNLNANCIIGNFEKGDEVKFFAITTELISFGVKYLIGIAALIHGNIYFSYLIHSNILKSEIGKIKHNVNYAFILNQLKDIINEECLIIINALIKSNNIVKGKVFIDKIIDLGINKYSGFLLRAIYEFKIGEIDKSLETINRAKNELGNNKSGEWRFSKCFLLLWKEDYTNFNKEKKLLLEKCKKYNYDDVFINDMVQFCDYAINEDSNKFQIYFWEGFFLYNFNGNLPLSLKYFEKFIEQLGNNEHIFKNECLKYIKDIKSKINIK